MFPQGWWLTPLLLAWRGQEADDTASTMGWKPHQRRELELVVEANAPIFAQEQEDHTGCRHVATAGWDHLPLERQSIMMSLYIAQAPEEEPSGFHKLFVCRFDPLFERFVPTNLAGLGELDAILRPEVGDASATLLGVRFVPDRDVAVHKLSDLIHRLPSFLFVFLQERQSARDANAQAPQLEDLP
jgi:hypothetical protein